MTMATTVTTVNSLALSLRPNRSSSDINSNDYHPLSSRQFSTAVKIDTDNITDLNEGTGESAKTTGPPTRKKKTTRRRKLSDPVIITENAAARIKEILSGPNAEGAIGIRLGVKRRGCNGLSYTLNYAFSKPEKDDEMTAHGVRVFIEPFALFNVVGTTMDYVDTELSSEFTFTNPNSKGECGCGESFTV
eukprot:CAMPEP_0172496430 /NCGR_PEP_ID=MMETSP1066-20121228/87255_1 /TAXON_ID=671091 /ORGANISM="Coscinodiscus wailesii, Strain CCMP2513" /LENGTH=189 /DNA_ID=CAMNT_0013268735 /DNA_START=143 /DNA_END=712 /DNA_ORIENTATION=+